MGKKNKKAMKAWRKEWITWGTENADYVINKALLQAFQDSYAEEKAKAEAALAAAFIHVPDPERPVQFVGPRELVENLHPIPQMGRGKTATIPLVQPTKKYLEVQEEGNTAEFEVMPDGSFHVAVTNNSWGGQFADINMNPEQFAAFKQWVMEN
jgi:hypothetical protein